MFKGLPNESGITVITPQLEGNDDCACPYIVEAEYWESMPYRKIPPDACVIAWEHVKRHRSHDGSNQTPGPFVGCIPHLQSTPVGSEGTAISQR
ncbi:hypothetical protein TNCV_4750661 [Trichonephila clavipes]|nr:hypothetical protein TNCV_4750661 [Trichonephila clavipes]